jgi:hypothetical protein
MSQPGRRGLSGRVAWHVGVAWRSSRWTALVAFAGGIAMRVLLPVDEVCVAGTVAAAAALLAVLLIVLGEFRAGRLPEPTLEPGAALEQVGAVDQVAHALARASLVLGSFTAGLALAGLLGLGRA